MFYVMLYVMLLVHVFMFYSVVTTRRGMPLRWTLSFFYSRRVDITQRGVTRVELLLCHIGLTDPRGRIRHNRVREIKCCFTSLLLVRSHLP